MYMCIYQVPPMKRQSFNTASLQWANFGFTNLVFWQGDFHYLPSDVLVIVSGISHRLGVKCFSDRFYFLFLLLGGLLCNWGFGPGCWLPATSSLCPRILFQCKPFMTIQHIAQCYWQQCFLTLRAHAQTKVMACMAKTSKTFALAEELRALASSAWRT